MLGRKADPQVESYSVSTHEAANHAETKANETAATAKPTRRPHCGCGLDTPATDMTSTIAQSPRGRSERAPYRRIRARSNAALHVAMRWQREPRVWLLAFAQAGSATLQLPECVGCLPPLLRGQGSVGESPANGQRQLPVSLLVGPSDEAL